MNEHLTKNDLDFILESLKYTKMKFEDHQHYPSYELKREQILKVEDVIEKIQKLKKEWVD